MGTILRVLPRITEEDNVLLDISAEDSSYTDKNVKSNDQTSTVPEKTKRMAETQLRVHTGDTVVLGGLRKDRSSDNLTKTPLLGDVPLLGRIFRNPTKVSKKESLMIFITTTIVDEFTHPEADELAQAEEKISSDARNNNRTLIKRVQNRLNSEITVSIGQSGSLYSSGKRVTIDDLRKEFSDKDNARKTVVIRSHPRAPEDALIAVNEAAMESNLKSRTTIPHRWSHLNAMKTPVLPRSPSRTPRQPQRHPPPRLHPLRHPRPPPRAKRKTNSSTTLDNETPATHTGGRGFVFRLN